MNLEIIKSKLNDYLANLGYELVTFSFAKKDGVNTLSVVIDRVKPIDMDTITEVSEKISSYLDEIDDSTLPYTLDVSSLGAEKPLKVECLKDYVNSYINVHVNNPIEGENIFEGNLISVNEESMTISVRNKTRVKNIVILLSNIYKVRLAIKF